MSNAADSALIALLSHEFRARHFFAGQILYLEDDPAAGIWFIQGGPVRIHAVAATGRQQTLCEVVGTNCLGCPLFLGNKNLACAEADGSGTLYCLPWDRFDAMLRTSTEICMAFLQLLARRQHTLLQVHASLAATQVPTRLAQLLLDASSRSPDMRITLTHEFMAQRVGTAREVVSRVLSRWAEEGLISACRRSITIHDADSLRRIARPICKAITSVADPIATLPAEDAPVGTSVPLIEAGAAGSECCAARSHRGNKAVDSLPESACVLGQVFSESPSNTIFTREEWYEPGETIVAEGQPYIGLAFLEAGRAAVSRQVDGVPRIVSLARPGDVLDFAPAVLEEARTWFTIRAVGPAKVRIIPANQLPRLLSSEAEFCRRLSSLVVRQFGLMVRRITDLSFKDVTQRLATYLKDEMMTVHSAEDHAIVVSRWLTLRDLASLLGTGPEVISRALARLARAGVIELAAGRVAILQPDSLCRIADGDTV